MSKILDFYRNEKPDTEGRMISEIWQWDHERLEICHDYIQWLFPLAVPSNFNPVAPLLTPEDQQLFKSSAALQSSVRKSLKLFIQFLGLDFDEAEANKPATQIIKSANFDNRKNLWSHPNHNWLRITRVLGSLRLCGLQSEAKIFFECLRKLHAEGFVSSRSFEFWQRAME